MTYSTTIAAPYSMTVCEAFTGKGASLDVATAIADGRPYEARTRYGATMKIARQMMADGLPDGPWRVVDTEGKLRYSGPSLHRLAGLTVAENDRIGPDIRRYRPMDEAAIM